MYFFHAVTWQLVSNATKNWKNAAYAESLFHLALYFSTVKCVFFFNIFLGICYTKTFLIAMFDNKTANMNNNSHEKCWFFFFAVFIFSKSTNEIICSNIVIFIK